MHLIKCCFVYFATQFFIIIGIGCAESTPIEFAVVVLSYKNEKWCIRNLQSITEQTYPYYKIFYVDDCSPDRTGELVQALIEKEHLEDKCVYIRNPSRQGAMSNFYKTIHKIPAHHVIVCVDGDDWLAHPQVLEHLAHVYADKTVWMTFGSYKKWPAGKSCASKPIPHWVAKKNAFRSYSWSTSHLKTFYAALFHRIHKEDLMWNGEFFPMSSDMAMMFPILEMSAKGHYRYLADTLYIYNVSNPINDDKVNQKLQKKTKKEILSRPAYTPLDQLFNE